MNPVKITKIPWRKHNLIRPMFSKLNTENCENESKAKE